jgi:hypothetical protein
MSTIGVVVISIIVGLMLAFLLAIGGVIVWLLLRLLKLVSSLPLLINELEVKLAKQTEMLDGKIGTINGAQLQRAAAECILAVKRIDQSTLAFAELVKDLLGGERIEVERAQQAGLGAEDFAPATGERYATQNKVAATDAQIENEEAADLSEGQW